MGRAKRRGRQVQGSGAVLWDLGGWRQATENRECDPDAHTICLSLAPARNIAGVAMLRERRAFTGGSGTCPAPLSSAVCCVCAALRHGTAAAARRCGETCEMPPADVVMKRCAQRGIRAQSEATRRKARSSAWRGICHVARVRQRGMLWRAVRERRGERFAALLRCAAKEESEQGRRSGRAAGRAHARRRERHRKAGRRLRQKSRQERQAGERSC